MDKIIFVVEGLTAKALRQVYQSLVQGFTAVKVVERVTDLAFSNIRDYDGLVFWSPKDRERVDSFIRNVRLRSKDVPMYVLCQEDEFLGIENALGNELVRRCVIVRPANLNSIYDIVAMALKLNSEPVVEKSEADEGVSNMFLSLLLYELNNPISVFSGALRVLERELKAQHRVAPVVLESIERLERTLWKMEKTVLSVRNLVGQQRTLEREECQVKSIIDFALETIETKSSENNIHIIRTGNENESLVCRKNEICQIMTNLAMNAVDAVVDEPEKQIEIRTIETDTHIVFKVIDSGKGVHPEIIQNIASQSTATKSSNVGLALLISKKLAEQNGGQLFYENTDGKTCFVLSMPKNPSKLQHAAS